MTIRLERELLKRLDELDEAFVKRFEDYLEKVVYLPPILSTKQVASWQLPHAGELARLLTDQAHEMFAIGQAHGNVLVRELHKKFSKHKLADWQPSWKLSIRYEPDPFWLVPERAIAALEKRSILLAGDVDGSIGNAVKGVMLDHLRGASRVETEADLARIKEVNLNRAGLITTTETTYAYNRGRIAAFHESDVEYVRFSAVIDARTSPQCRSRHGKVMRLDSSELANNIPPLHGRCRSVLSPVYGEYQPELLVKENLDWSKVEALPKNWRTDTTERKDVIMKESFALATNIKEANQYAEKVLGVRAEYKGCDIRVANDWNKGLKDTFDQFSALRQAIKFTGEAHEQNVRLKPIMGDYFRKHLQLQNPGVPLNILEPHIKKAVEVHMRRFAVSRRTYARSWTPKQEDLQQLSGITVNRDIGRDFDDFVRRLKKDTASQFHPIGCDTVRSVLDHEIGHQLDDLLDLSNHKGIQELFNQRNLNELTKALSKYAWDNENSNRYGEFIAEAWAEYCNNPEPREIAKKVGDIIKEAYVQWEKKNS